ncbi:MAG: hypothetical protein RL033_4506, partial [Pseudomonadota bacterium]
MLQSEFGKFSLKWIIQRSAVVAAPLARWLHSATEGVYGPSREDRRLHQEKLGERR